MNNQRQLNIRIDSSLYEAAQHKCYSHFGITLSSLIKVFLKSFVTQNGVGFYVGDDDLCRLFAKWITKKRMDKDKNGGTHIYGPFLKDLYNLGDTGKLHS